nr:MAG TPA: hypothetical protein [Caudoviricetes sp.]DAX31544.1 MAG TPA: hypothetical protein [Caudoviricetes sp.]
MICKIWEVYDLSNSKFSPCTELKYGRRVKNISNS